MCQVFVLDGTCFAEAYIPKRPYFLRIQPSCSFLVAGDERLASALVVPTMQVPSGTYHAGT